MHRPHKFDPPWVDFFTRPCPWFVKQLTSFPQFSKLPAEIQLMIWELAQPCRQVVSLSCPTSSWLRLLPRGAPPPRIRLKYRRSGMLKASCDARTAGLKSFIPALEAYLPSPIRFNFDRDVLELDMHMVEWIATVHEEGRSPLVEPPMVKNLAVSHYRQIRSEDLVLICQYFSGLEFLMLNEPELDRSAPSGGYPCNINCKEANLTWRFRWQDIIVPIMIAIRGVRPQLTRWQIPVVNIGTDTQWARTALVPRSIRLDVCEAARGPDIMDWSPTVTFPSLAYAPRFEVANGQVAAICAQQNTTVNWTWEYGMVLEMAIMRSWVFGDTALRFCGVDTKDIEDAEDWVWPGREDIRISSQDYVFM